MVCCVSFIVSFDKTSTVDDVAHLEKITLTENEVVRCKILKGIAPNISSDALFSVGTES